MKLRSKLMIAEQSRLFGEPTVSLNEAKKRLEEKYSNAEVVRLKSCLLRGLSLM